MTEDGPTAEWTSERTLRLALTVRARDHPARVTDLAARLRTRLGDRLDDAVPGMRTLTLFVDPLTADRAMIEDAALEEAGRTPWRTHTDAHTPEILFCPAPELAPDLGRLPADALARCCARDFRVALFGVAPGFAYLEGLPPELHRPRLDTPRPRIAPGSVAIADRYAAVYPSATPGGWNIIGRTNRVMFDPTRDPPALLRVGDAVRFVRITRDEFESTSA